MLYRQLHFLQILFRQGRNKLNNCKSDEQFLVRNQNIYDSVIYHCYYLLGQLVSHNFGANLKFKSGNVLFLYLSRLFFHGGNGPDKWGRDRICTQGVGGCPLVYQYKCIICTLFITFIIFWYLLIKNCIYFRKVGKIVLAVLDACNGPVPLYYQPEVTVIFPHLCSRREIVWVKCARSLNT